MKCKHTNSELVGSIVVGDEDELTSFDVWTCKDCKLSRFEKKKVKLDGRGIRKDSSGNLQVSD